MKIEIKDLSRDEFEAKMHKEACYGDCSVQTSMELLEGFIDTEESMKAKLSYVVVFLDYYVEKNAKGGPTYKSTVTMRKLLETYELLLNKSGTWNKDKELLDMCFNYLKPYEDVNVNYGLFISLRFDTRIGENKLKHEYYLEEFSYNILFHKNKSKFSRLPETQYRFASYLLKGGKRYLELCSGPSRFSHYANDYNVKYYGYDIDPFNVLYGMIINYLYEYNYTGYKGNIYSLSDEIKKEKKFDRIFAYFPYDTVCSKEDARKILDSFDTKFKLNTSSIWLKMYSVLNLLADDGKAVVCFPTSALSNTIDREIRKYFITNGYIESVIGMPKSFSLFSTIVDHTFLVISRNNKKIKVFDTTKKEYSVFLSGDIDVKLAFNDYCKKKDYLSFDDMENKRYNLDVYSLLNDEIKFKNAKSIKELAVDVFRGCQDNFDNEKDKEKEYINGMVISTGDIVNNVLFPEEAFDFGDILCIGKKKANKYKLEDLDILITCKYTAFKAIVFEKKCENEKLENKYQLFASNHNKVILPNGNFIVIRVDKNKIDPYYLAAYLNSREGKEQIDYIKTGDSICSINKLALLDYKVPMKTKEERAKFAKNYKDSIEKIKESLFTIRKAEKCIDDLNSDELIKK